MPRPSLKDQRSAQILDAYLTCVARFGLEGATQERIAQAADVKRPLLRHYLGNRDEMVSALATHVLDGFEQSVEALKTALPAGSTPADLVDLLFAEDSATDPRLMLAYQSLVAAVPTRPDLREGLLDSLTGFFDVIEQILREAVPQASDSGIRAVTQGLSALFVNLDALSPLEPPASWRADLRRAATLLVSSLETPE